MAYYLKFVFIVLSTGLFMGNVSAQTQRYKLPRGVAESDYEPRTIVVKTRTRPFDRLRSRPIVKRDRAIPHTAARSSTHPLANIYKITIDHDDIVGEINELLQDENVAYAEPLFYHRPLLVPNDPEANPDRGGQKYLSVIKAYDAWTVERGDSAVVIGILDTGVDDDHPDLKAQIARNTNDPINGVDDDGDGLVDNYMGWDIADGDNNPAADKDAHGTRVAGISAARANNGQGMAGVGFNSKFLPIKIFTSRDNRFSNGYEAIALAADMGCKVINLSWGSAGSFSQFGQDVIDYAVLEKDVVIVAAAGNTNKLLDFYPASYDHVLSVSATTLDDVKALFATYSYKVDMVAPGSGIFTTDNDGGYHASQQGTSFSAPMVAGAAALVRARFPNLNALQVMEKLRVTSDDIYRKVGNISYTGLLGKGRLNVLEALTNTATPALRIESVSYNNNLGAFIYAGDALRITISIRNYLAPLAEGRATISTNSPYATIINDQIPIDNLGTLSVVDNISAPFTLVISDDLPPDEELVFRVDFEGGFYSDFQYFSINASTNYTTARSGQFGLTVCGDGDLGYDQSFFRSGIGVQYEGKKMLDNLGLILSFDQNSVADNAPLFLSRGYQNNDFQLLQPQKRFANGTTPVDIRSVFSVADSVLIAQKTIADGSSDFIVQEYRITNTGTVGLEDFGVSLYADWDIGDKKFNEAGWDESYRLGYVHNHETYMGIALLTGQDPLYSAVNNSNFNGNTADVPSILTDSVKYSHTSRSVLKTTAGEVNEGNDVSHFIGAMTDTLAVSRSTKVTFAFVAGKSLAELQALVEMAGATYSDYQSNPPVIYTQEACRGEVAFIDPPGNNFDFYTDAGLTNLISSGSQYETPPVSETMTYYVVNTDSAYRSDVASVVVKLKQVNADFDTDISPLLLDETGNTMVQFYDRSDRGASWHWDFDNGFTSAIRNPLISFTYPGTYNVSLAVTDDIGCTDSVVLPFEVAYRSVLPDIENKQLCKGEEVVLEATNATVLEFYSDEELSNLIFRGASFLTAFDKDTTIYVVSVDSAYRSNVLPVKIDIEEVWADFRYAPDTSDISDNTLVRFYATATEYEPAWYINDRLISTQNEWTYNYKDDELIGVRLTVKTPGGCEDTAEQTIVKTANTSPAPESFYRCKGEPLTIDPPGDFLHFYADEALTQLIGKGTSIRLPGSDKDTSIFVTDNSGLMESTASEFVITVSNLSAFIKPGREPANILEGEAVPFFDTGTDAVNWQWFVNGRATSTEKDPLITFDKIGTNEVALVVADAAGCYDTASAAYMVANITAIEDNPAFTIYPNPSTGKIYFKQPLSHVALYDMRGKLLRSLEGPQRALILTGLPAGTYMLAGERGARVLRFRISLVVGSQ